MNNDLVREMGYITLATRLKRISDKMTHSTRAMYRKLKIDIEPNWYLVFTIVKENPCISVMEISEKLGFTHQSIITMTNKMVKKNYVIATKDQKDKRKTIFSITEKTFDIIPEIEQIWKYGEEVLFELIEGDISIVKHLEVLESNLEKASFGERILIKKNTH